MMRRECQRRLASGRLCGGGMCSALDIEGVGRVDLCPGHYAEALRHQQGVASVALSDRPNPIAAREAYAQANGRLLEAVRAQPARFAADYAEDIRISRQAAVRLLSMGVAHGFLRSERLGKKCGPYVYFPIPH